jgi:hypothetical protein
MSIFLDIELNWLNEWIIELAIVPAVVGRDEGGLEKVDVETVSGEEAEEEGGEASSVVSESCSTSFRLGI